MPKGNSRYDTEHLRNISAYQRQIDEIFRAADEEAARIVKASGAEYDPDRPFSFDDYPSVKKRVDKMTSDLASRVERTIVNGIKAQWGLSNRKNDELVETVTGLKADDLPADQRRRWFGTNEPARDAFIRRETEGMNLSEEVWRFRRETELGIDLSLKDLQDRMERGLSEGVSAADMSRELRGYLKNPDKLFRRVRDERGNLTLSRNARLFHPGQGVYRSSYMNARRLAATETNMAYRSADHERWKSLDFVVGIEIQTSNNHTTKDSKGKPQPLEDICDTLAGRYPKDFKFVGWHPHCRCIATTILKTEEEMAKDTERILNGEEPLPPESSANYEGNLPKNFTDWVTKNEARIAKAKSLPYFLKDNEDLIKEAQMPEEIAREYDKMADLFPDVRKWYGRYTPEEIKEVYKEATYSQLKDMQGRSHTDEQEVRELDNLLKDIEAGYLGDLKAIEVLKDYLSRRITEVSDIINNRNDWEEQWLSSKAEDTTVVTTLDEFGRLTGGEGNVVIWDKANSLNRPGMLADKVLFDGASKNWRGSGEDGKDSIFNYTAGSGHLNKPLQGRDYDGDVHQSLQEFTEDVNRTTAYINNERLPYDMVLKRLDDDLSAMTGRLNFMGKQMPSDVKDLVGMEVTDFGFMSTTAARELAFNDGKIKTVEMYIYAPKGTRAAYVEPFSHFGALSDNGKNPKLGRAWDGKTHMPRVSDEDEVTLQRGTSYVVRRVEEGRGKVRIWCDIVGQNPSDFSYVKEENLSH